VEDFALVIASIALLAGAALLLWRAVAGPSRNTGRRLGRVAVALLLAFAIAGVGAYELMRSRSFQLAGDLVQRVDTAERVVALTFDDGPTPKHTEWVLDLLEERNIHATFYLSGGESEANPESLAAIIAAGHELGNHTYDGRRLVFLTGSAVADEVERTDAVFRAAGYDARTTIRPPGCKRLLTAPLYFAGHERTTLTWDLEPDSIESMAGDADAMTRYVADGVRPGSIVLMHIMYDSREASREALPAIIEQLERAGYRFVTVSQLLALRAQP
jgi:peptidoglycan-N-acetylglucosamine deacetylase